MADLPPALDDLAPAVTDLLASYRLERYVRRERDEGANPLKKEVVLGPEFAELWERIKPRTTYRVEFETEELIRRCCHAVEHMERIRPPTIRVETGGVSIERGGVRAISVGVAQDEVDFATHALPDILGYLQEQTELTRSTLARILTESGRLSEFLVHPQRYMDAVAAILKAELHRLLVDGIKYERIEGGAGAECEMTRFLDNKEFVDYLSALQVKKSVYDYVPYDSEIERRFAEDLDVREDVKLFVKLPSWFKVETPVGAYNPDWAIVKQNGALLCLVRETKGTRDLLRLRSGEADKVGAVNATSRLSASHSMSSRPPERYSCPSTARRFAMLRSG